ncbi:galectin-6-like isoform X2 [Colossoma macropomum]|uniref:galectin-6-like isoform X2 n=1 Tax=Colossoma macropomum TaxID=42526 RepID=UPI0018645C11|nr:galectin-6-like isoform X2 [Colossoma macropomum]
MANKRTIQEILLNVLENLNDGEQKMFQWYLSQEVLDKYPPIPKAKIEGASLEETVNQLIEFNDNSAAAKITERTLERMNQKQLARRLEGALEKGFFPEVPYVQILPQGLSDQTLIAIYGEPKPNAEIFQINLQKGDNVAFHFNPRFNEDGKQVIVRNTRIKGVWGPEERELPFFPFTPGKPFVIKISCTSSDFIVEVDDRYLLSFTHRMKDLDRIKTLAIEGDVVLKYVVTDFFPEVPYVQILPQGLSDQTLITIYGEPKRNAEIFQINLQKGDNVAFHFNPRFNEDGKQLIVRNTRIKGVWGPEERELPFFPFTPGKPFEIKISCTSSDFIVEVDDRYLLSFTHRMKDLDRIKTLAIEGDVVLKYVVTGP